MTMMERRPYCLCRPRTHSMNNACQSKSVISAASETWIVDCYRSGLELEEVFSELASNMVRLGNCLG